MEAELAALALAGAKTLVGLMASDGWERVKGAFVAILGKNSTNAGGNAEADLERSRGELLAADEIGDGEAQEELIVEWRGRLSRLLRAHPELAEDISTLVAEFGGQPTTSTARDITMTAKAEGHGRVYQQGQGTQRNG